MTRDEVLTVLRQHRAELEAQGVTHAALFGSLARGEEKADSDIDIMVEIDPEAHIGVWGFSGVILYIQNLFEYAVDVSERRALRTHVRPSAERDAIYAF
ncbi:nucleotidyltransferase family protein [uncultured Brevundimonas sp.]|uniref:nucleotidyltransferase family protein n=1 Tax=uncultured Brevundimonas sp. TaxID=213418 RepID=UPI00262C6A67|nr:nucleotidyltransferase family protein [uncultured Brevundimonas sp.]